MTLVVMVQREVAERFVAKPGGRDYGLPSIVAGIHSEASVAFNVPPQVFLPPPSVTSSVVVLRRVKAPESAERAIEIASTAFKQRRKMLRRSLDGIFESPVAVLESAGIDPTSRAEDLSPLEYLALASA